MNSVRVLLKRLCRLGLLAGMAVLAFTVGMAEAQVPPADKTPLPLDQVTAPDVNKLGLLDCTGPGLNPATCGAQYTGFPITKKSISADPDEIKKKLVVLGKALFWDMQIGSDGVQACASCHFHAGADHRIINQKNPGLNRVSGTQLKIRNAINPSQLTPSPDTTFTDIGANGTLTPGHFPLTVDASAAAAPNFGNNDVVSSQGVHAGTFSSLSGTRVENGTPVIDTNGFGTARRVPPRNTPSAVGAVFNLRNFWDGRANLFFNGVNPFGMLDTNARVTITNPTTFAQSRIRVMIPFSSLASQAVGPPGSDFEMSLSNRTFQHIAEKVLKPLPPSPATPPTTTQFRPLDRQAIASDDSVFSPPAIGKPAGYIATGGKGLNESYINLIKEIFQDKYWRADSSGTNLTVMKKNFALFFGLAVQAYEATLIPDQTPVDDLLRGLNGALPNPTSGNPVERGLAVFLSGRAGCSGCHVGSETTSATVSNLSGFGNPAAVVEAGVAIPEVALAERMPMGDGSISAYDSGFYNIGVRPTADDLSIFNRFGQIPFSFSMLAKEIRSGNPNVSAVNSLLLSGTLRLPTAPNNLAPLPFAITVGCDPGRPGRALGIVDGKLCPPFSATERVAVRGSFKTPGLRNLTLTGPYFHNGSKKSIEEVLEFYNAGGHFNLDFNPDNCAANSLTCRKGQVDFDAEIKVGAIRTAAEGSTEFADVLAFLKALTDSRVAHERAPFDHPQLCLPHGSGPLMDLPAVGAGGHSSEILTFEQMLAGAGSSEQHALNTGCQMNPLPTVGTTPP